MLVTLSIYTAVILELSQLLSILPIDPKEFILVPFVLVEALVRVNTDSGGSAILV